MKLEEQRKLAHENRFKYLKAPTIDEIDLFIKELDVSDNQFERFFGMAFNTIGQVRAKTKKLPAKFWHIIYEKIVPSYSTHHQEIQKKSLSKTLSKQPVKEQEPQQELPVDNPLLSRLLLG